MQNYSLGIQIGKGNYGTVYQATFKKTGKVYALKKLKYNKQFLSQRIPNFARQLQSLEILSHPNIVGLFETFEDNNMICIVMDLCTRGDLANYITQGDKKMTDQEKLELFGQILQGMHYIHKENYMHRDLKPENIMITENLTAKIGDFGMIKKYQDQIKHSIAGTPLYAAPQILDQSGHYTKKCDVFSIGLILYFIIFKYQFFNQAKSMQDLKDLQQRKTKPNSLKELLENLQCSEIFKKLLSKSLCYYEEDRATMQQLRQLYLQLVKPQTNKSKVQQSVLQYIDSFFSKFYKQTNILNEYTVFLKQLETNKALKIKTIKRYTFIYLIGCKLILEYERMIEAMKTEKIQDSDFNEVRNQWMSRMLSKVKEYKCMCERVSKKILQKKSHEYLKENKEIVTLVQDFIVKKSDPAKYDYLQIVKFLIDKEKKSKRKTVERKEQFFNKLQQMI